MSDPHKNCKRKVLTLSSPDDGGSTHFCNSISHKTLISINYTSRVTEKSEVVNTPGARRPCNGCKRRLHLEIK
jgi:hypothetical protein